MSNALCNVAKHFPIPENPNTTDLTVIQYNKILDYLLQFHPQLDYIKNNLCLELINHIQNTISSAKQYYLDFKAFIKTDNQYYFLSIPKCKNCNYQLTTINILNNTLVDLCYECNPSCIELFPLDGNEQEDQILKLLFEKYAAFIEQYQINQRQLIYNQNKLHPCMELELFNLLQKQNKHFDYLNSDKISFYPLNVITFSIEQQTFQCKNYQPYQINEFRNLTFPERSSIFSIYCSNNYDEILQFLKQQYFEQFRQQLNSQQLQDLKSNNTETQKSSQASKEELQYYKLLQQFDVLKFQKDSIFVKEEQQVEMQQIHTNINISDLHLYHAVVFTNPQSASKYNLIQTQIFFVFGYYFDNYIIISHHNNKNYVVNANDMVYLTFIENTCSLEQKQLFEQFTSLQKSVLQALPWNMHSDHLFTSITLREYFSDQELSIKNKVVQIVAVLKLNDQQILSLIVNQNEVIFVSFEDYIKSFSLNKKKYLQICKQATSFQLHPIISKLFELNEFDKEDSLQQLNQFLNADKAQMCKIQQLFQTLNQSRKLQEIMQSELELNFVSISEILDQLSATVEQTQTIDPKVLQVMCNFVNYLCGQMLRMKGGFYDQFDVNQLDLDGMKSDITEETKRILVQNCKYLSKVLKKQ